MQEQKNGGRYGGTTDEQDGKEGSEGRRMERIGGRKGGRYGGRMRGRKEGWKEV